MLKTINETNPEGILHFALELFASGEYGTELVKKKGRLSKAIPVIDLTDNSINSWFVPITVSTRLVSFFQISPAKELLRYSSFLTSDDHMDRCPLSADWLDLKRIQGHASTFCRNDERMGEPVLTYDQHPSRLAWSVPLMDRDGHERVVFVTGKSAYLPSKEGGIF